MFLFLLYILSTLCAILYHTFQDAENGKIKINFNGVWSVSLTLTPFLSHGYMYLLLEYIWMVKSLSQSFTKLRAFNELRKQRFISTYIFSCYLSLFSFFQRFSILIFRNSLWFCCFSSNFLSGFPHKNMWTEGKGAACLYEDFNSGFV